MGLYLLVGAGIVFSLLFALNNLLKTIFRRPKIGFLDLLLTFMTTLVLLASLIVAQTQESPDGHIAQVALYVGGGLAAFSLLVTLLELIRPPRLKGSRGILGIYSGLLLVIASFGVPFAAAYFSVQTEAAAAPTQVAQASTPGTAAALSTEEIDLTRQARSNAIFKSISQIVTDEIHIDVSTVTKALQAGTPLATIIDAHGGSVEHVISAITLLMQDNVRQALAAGDINPIQAALAISQMENFIRIAVNSDFNQLGGRLGLATQDPNLTQTPFFTFPTDETESASSTVQSAPQSPAFMASSTVQSSPVKPTVSATRTPRPTHTPMPTMFHFSTRTPTPTPTLVTPCVASVQYNLRLRAAPDRAAETLLTIPFGTTITLFAKGSASDNGALWWYASYQDQTGWVDGQYMIVSAACDSLPFREAP
ncbi:MAG: hypothetical protein GC204_18150 [Chloroflexi bacterium]|nr:hypothetical protein [Chloroflexota bacterium]